MLGLTILSVASCSDIYDEHYGLNDSSNSNGPVGTQTLWEIIKNTPEMSNFATLAEGVHYFRDEKHPQPDYTYRNLLESTLSHTVWVPTNDAYSQEEWGYWMELAKTSPYTVQEQLLANSIALWRQDISDKGIDTITLLNGKKHAFDKTNATIANISLVGEPVAGKNGTLYSIGQPIPFAYNLYEYLKDKANANRVKLTEMHEFIMENDTTYFFEDGSTEGTPDENGEPTYIDSMYVTTNHLFSSQFRFPSNMNTERYDTYNEGFNANIIAEDSSFIMILPTDDALRKATDKLRPYYNYATSYADAVKGNNSEYKNRELVVEGTTIDSLIEKSIKMDLLSPLVFNVNLQPNSAERIGRWNVDNFITEAIQAPYLRNTFGDTLRSDNSWQKESLFEGEAKAMSNGYGIITDTWNFPSKFYKPDVIVEANFYRLWNKKVSEKNTSYRIVSFSNEIASNWVDSVGRVSNNDFIRLAPKGTQYTKASMEFILRGSQQETYDAEVMSGKYDIYIVMVPSFYESSTDSIEGERKKATIEATINYNLQKRKSAGGAESADQKSLGKITYDGEKVDTILLAQDFEFKYSYKNLINCYPTITISSNATRNDINKNGFSNTIFIDRIILKSKD